MANDKQVEELKRKVTDLVNGKYGGDWTRAFTHYAGLNGTASLVGEEELGRLLKDAGVGNGLTRGAWITGVMKELDTSKDEYISWAEFQAKLDTKN